MKYDMFKSQPPWVREIPDQDKKEIVELAMKSFFYLLKRNEKINSSEFADRILNIYDVKTSGYYATISILKHEHIAIETDNTSVSWMYIPELNK